MEERESEQQPGFIETSAERPRFASSFICEKIEPCGAEFDGDAAASGGAGAPLRFMWRGREVRVKAVLSSKKTLRPCRNGSGERYVGKHVYRVETDEGEIMMIYRERSGKRKDRWTLYTIEKSR